jgi:hypothetical protein
MRVHTFKRTQRFKQPLHIVFSFFQNPENLARITPSSLGFKMLTPSPIQMRQGVVIDYTVSPLLIPMRWTTLIAEYDPPHTFVDIQLKGPYSMWHHTHSFRAIEGGTEMTDDVRFVMPLLILGDIVHTLVVRRQLEEIFDFRARAIAEFLSSQTTAHGQ